MTTTLRAIREAEAELRRLRREARHEREAVERRESQERRAMYKLTEDPRGVHRRCRCGALVVSWILRPARDGGVGGEVLRCEAGHECTRGFIVVDPSRVGRMLGRVVGVTEWGVAE